MEPSIMLSSGHLFDFLAPSVEEVPLEVLARSLSIICRFAGHTDVFYSVAEHSFWVSQIVPEDLALAGLFHDLHEALVGDVPSPLKALLPEYREIERRAWKAVAGCYGLPVELPPEVKRADLVMLATERRYLMPDGDKPWASLKGIKPLTLAARLGMPPEQACRLFMDRARELMSPDCALRAASSPAI